MKLPTRIDSCFNHEVTIELWKHKFATTLNEVNDEIFNDFLNGRLRNCPVSDVKFVTQEEECLFASFSPIIYVETKYIYIYIYCDKGIYDVLAVNIALRV